MISHAYMEFVTQTHRVIIGGERVWVGERYFNVYCRAALARIANPSSGYLTVDEIERLPGWEGRKPASIGKKIGKHIQDFAKRGYYVLEWRDGENVGPYRLALPPDSFRFADALVDEVRANLILAERRRYLQRREEPAFFRFVEALGDAEIALRGGDEQRELLALRSAAQAAVFPHQRMLVEVAMANAFLHRYRFEALEVAHDEIQLLLPHSGRYRLWGQLRVHEQAALAVLNRAGDEGRSLTTAEINALENHVQCALDISRQSPHASLAADLFRILGVVATNQGDYPHAERYFHRALDDAACGRHFSMIVTLYVEIARMERKWGNAALFKARDRGLRRGFAAAGRRYSHAIALLRQAIRLRDELTLDRIAGREEFYLGQLLWRIGELEEADDCLEKARTVAHGLEPEIEMLACSFLAYTCLEQKRDEDARQILRQCEASVPPHIMKSMDSALLKFLRTGDEGAINLDRLLPPEPQDYR